MRELSARLPASFGPAEEGGDVMAVEVLALEGCYEIVTLLAEIVGGGVGVAGCDEDVGEQGAADEHIF